MELWLDNNEIVIGYKDGRSTSQLSGTEVASTMDTDQFDSDPDSCMGLIKDGDSFRSLAVGDPNYAEQLDALKKERQKEITVERDSKIEDGFTYEGKEIQCDNVSQLNANAFLTSDSQGMIAYPIQWRTKDNQYITLVDSTALKLFTGSMMLFVQTIFTESWTVKDAIEVATHKEDVESAYSGYMNG